MYTDAHIHLKDLADKAGGKAAIHENTLVCASAWNRDEFRVHETIAAEYPGRVFLSFGIHPQNPDRSLIPFLEQLAGENRISAIGECGLDFFTPEYRKNREEQEYVWAAQRTIALDAGLPLVLHGRKAMAEFFAASSELARLPAVVFHGWGGSVVEAHSFLDRGIHAYFSVGKALLRGHRNLRETVRAIEPDRLLSETDAPWMPLRGEPFSRPEDIVQVVGEMAAVRGMAEYDLKKQLRDNFLRIFTKPGETQQVLQQQSDTPFP